MPAGNVPDCTLYVYGITPLVTLLKALNGVIAVLCTPATDVVAPAVAEGGGTITVKLTVTLVVANVLYASTTLNFTLADEYAVVGVPLTRPVVLLIVIPVGSVPELT
jgi:hypothetical protein